MAEGIYHENTTVEEVEEIDSDETSSLINLSRDERATIAEDTLNILNAGWYQPPRYHRIDLKEDIAFCVNNSILYEENDLHNTAKRASTVDETEARSGRDTATAVSSYPKFEVRHCTSLQAAQSLVEQMGEEHVGVLNFASAKNPGGGFRKGANAQEESLVRSSSLYLSLSQDRLFTEFYGYHRRTKDGIYSHRIIYSPRVTIFKV
jgi:uncharacterized protein (TIGR02452 family)